MESLPLIIDCHTCVARMTDTCNDCIVTFLCDTPVAERVVMREPEARVLRLLSDGGLIPGLRHRPESAAS